MKPRFLIAIGLALLAHCAYASTTVGKGSSAKVGVKKTKKAATAVNVSVASSARVIAPGAAKKIEVGLVVGSQTISEVLGGHVRTEEVTVTESTPERTAYSSGDVVGNDGQALQVRMGEVVVVTKSKQGLWKFPLQADTSGEAKIVTITHPELDEGSVVWKTVAAGPGKMEVQAKITYNSRYSVVGYDLSTHLIGYLFRWSIIARILCS